MTYGLSSVRDRIRSRLSEERGFGLIEVLVSALLITIVGLGVMSGLDTAGAQSGHNKARAVAGSLAQDDQERLRALSPAEISQRRVSTRTVTVAGMEYEIQSRVRPVGDTPAGTRGCTSSSRGFDYLQISSTVSWTSLGDRPPVRTDSLVAAKFGGFGAGQGGIAVQIRSRDGSGQSGIGVSLSGGTTSDSDTTDENGCAFFAFLPVGNYTVSFKKGNYVTPEGENAVSDVVGVVEDAVNSIVYDYDAPGGITARPMTVVGGQHIAEQPDDRMFVAHGNLPAPGTRDFAWPSTGSTLYPYSSPYGVYSGSCSANAPAAGEYSGTPVIGGGNPVGLATIQPGGAALVDVYEPSIALRLSSPLSGPVYLTSSACGARQWTLVSTGSGSSQRWRKSALPAAGQTADLGFPYGVYRACTRISTNSSLEWTVNNTSRAGVDQTLSLVGAQLGGRCPS